MAKSASRSPFQRTLLHAAAASLLLCGAPALAHNDNHDHDHKGAAAAGDKAPDDKGGGPSSFDKKPAIGTQATCPVSGEHFTVKKKTPMSTYKGRVYAFCCADCKPDFDKDPEKFANKK